MTTTHQNDYREQLKSEMKRRQMVNPRYSLRAFALTLGLSAAFVSKVLSGQKNFSVETANLVAEKLGFSRPETQQFCQLVQIQNTKSSKLRSLLAGAETDEEFNPLTLDTFQAMSDWYHYAILELTNCRGFRAEPRYIAAKLKISEDEARGAVDRLLRLGLLKHKQGRLAKTNRFIATPTERASSALRHFHSQMIEKARRALEEQSVAERDITGITMSLRAENLALAKEEIGRFRRRMAKLMDSEKSNQAYQLNVQFFALSERTDKEPS
jgi:uncharacterized protein (TIGR02147 family)